MMTLRLAVITGTISAVAMVSPAYAQVPNSHPYHPFAYYGYPYHYPTYAVDQIPYFSQNPPVYYSYPVARPYGWSPYPYPPGYVPQTPEDPEKAQGSSSTTAPPVVFPLEPKPETQGEQPSQPKLVHSLPPRLKTIHFQWSVPSEAR